ncbi:GNAT family N-acetyltransferase [Cohnella fermenti]|uniref:GNAT family N-acetyltransferase n=1 Tax=Cohnella fermenti TaxID=2565925 RepID=A0A4S4BWI1_9BACL|nr:GNAT family N-acetyltransferase [Cohnella fermenti]THF79545.1 GNAT family N-acetyltransferase [Cohnella fermenti]
MANYRYVTQKVNEEIRVREARPEDAARVMELLVQTAAWLRSMGSSQWGALLEGNDYHHTEDAVRRGDVFVFEREEELAGVVMLLRQPSAWDLDLWGGEGHEGAVYVHRLAVSRLYRGRQLGRDMLAWVRSGIRFGGQDRIRLDCIADNPVLNDFYTRMGFAHRGVSEGGFCKYELLLPERTPDLL